MACSLFRRSTFSNWYELQRDNNTILIYLAPLQGSTDASQKFEEKIAYKRKTSRKIIYFFFASKFKSTKESL